MPIDKITRREFLKRGWKYTKAGILIPPSLSLLLASCKKPKDKPIIIPNNAPTIQNTSLPNAIENQPYLVEINAIDPESDNIIYSISRGSAGNFLEINPDTGELYNHTNIDDIFSGTTHDLTIKAEDDKGKFSEKTFNLYVANVSDITGQVVSALDLTPIQGARVNIGSHIAVTDINGNWVLSDVDDGEYPVIIKGVTDDESDYVFYKAGKIPVNKNNQTLGKLINLYFGLKPKSHNDFVYDTILKNTGLRTEDYDEKFHTIIYTKDFSGVSDMPQSVVDLIKSYTINERSQFSCKNYTESDISINNVDLPTVPPPNGTTILRWNTAFTGGGAKIWVDGNKIISSYICLSSDLGSAPNIESIILTEILRILTDGGDDSFNNTPQGYMGPPQTTTLQPPDTLNSNLSYGPCKRPWSNKDERTPENYDVNPENYDITNP